MSDSTYDLITARHYEAYRPPLHQMILSKCLKENADAGLDIGCGVGHSCIALAGYCDRVVGLEPSVDMLQKSKPHPKVTYKHFNGVNIDLEDDSFDIITFAGSLFYAKSQELLDEVVRLSRHNTEVIVYDFEVILEKTLADLGVDLNELRDEPYNHRIDFSGLKNDRINLVLKSEELIDLTLNPQQLAHLLLSTKSHYIALAEQHEGEDLFQSVSTHLSNISGGGSHNIQARIFYTTYRVLVD